jgi:excisionase family DNA binding protein
MKIHSTYDRGDLERMAYSVNEACRLLSIGRTSLYELVHAGDLTLIKIAGRTLVPRSEIERLTSINRAA